ncbi:MAG: hypothetical protein ACRBI6_17135 [Acidimicrobiales bacterium]
MPDLDARIVVCSPFQVLMAIEALDHFGIDAGRTELTLLHSSEPRSVTALRGTVEHAGLPWRVVDTGPRSTLRQWSRASQIRALADQPADRLFVGDLRNPHMAFLASAAPPGTVHVVDDGRGTIQAAAARAAGEPLVPASAGRRLQLGLLGLQRPPASQVTFFSIFRLETSGDDRVVDNPLRRLRRQVSTTPVGDHVLLLGSPFVELGSMTSERYVDIVVTAARQLGGPVVFRPHRRERADKLDALRARGVDIDPGDGPVELALLEAPVLPRRVSSFFSTATFTLWRLLGASLEIDSFSLRPEDFTDDFLSWNDGVPDLLEQSDGAIPILELDEVKAPTIDQRG